MTTRTSKVRNSELLSKGVSTSTAKLYAFVSPSEADRFMRLCEKSGLSWQSVARLAIKTYTPNRFPRAVKGAKRALMIEMPSSEKRAIADRADSMSVTASQYCRACLIMAMEDL